MRTNKKGVSHMVVREREREREPYRRGEGITLIALIITIIVMLILAGVAIGSITRGNLLGRAKDAVGLYDNSVNEEESVYGELQGMLDNATNGGNTGGTATGVFYTSGKNIIDPTGKTYVIKAISITNDVWAQPSWRN